MLKVWGFGWHRGALLDMLARPLKPSPGGHAPEVDRIAVVSWKKRYLDSPLYNAIQYISWQEIGTAKKSMVIYNSNSCSLSFFLKMSVLVHEDTFFDPLDNSILFISYCKKQ